MGPTSDDRYPYKRKAKGDLTQTQKRRHRRRPCEDGGRDWSDFPTNEGEPPEAGRAKEGISLRVFGRSTAPLSP